MSALGALLDQLPRTSLIVGKGGVGKTTCAAGIAAHYARRGERTLLLSTDPAAALSTVLGTPVGTADTVIDGHEHLVARQLSAPELRAAFLGRWRATLAEILDRGTYLERGEIDGLVDAAFPGADEVFALLALAEILASAPAHARLIVDTAPTGHTLRLLALPATFAALVSMLDMMQGKHRFMVRTLTRRYRRDEVDDFLDQMQQHVDVLRGTLANQQALAAIVVTRPEKLVLAETARYADALSRLHIRLGAVLVNAVDAASHAESFSGPLDDVVALAAVPRYRLPQVAPPPRGVDGAMAVLGRLTQQTGSGGSRRRRTPPHRASPKLTVDAPRHDWATPVLSKALVVVGGKGGVGKSTVACALGVVAAEWSEGQTLLVSTDPAPSIADAFGAADAAWARADLEVALPEAPGLFVRQMDATAAFARVRGEYQSRIDTLFDALIGRGLDVERDRAIVRELLSLAPPGIDELFALSILGDALAAGRYRRVIVDPAPTGHLLRLLEMPALALDWTHRLMRLMLDYREVAPLGDAAAELLAFAKRTRALDSLLRDPSRSGLVLVALDEPVVRSETIRLAAGVRERGLEVTAVIWNRLTGPINPLPAPVAARQLFADEVDPPPIGAGALAVWCRSWRDASASL